MHAAIAKPKKKYLKTSPSYESMHFKCTQQVYRFINYRFINRNTNKIVGF